MQAEYIECQYSGKNLTAYEYVVKLSMLLINESGHIVKRQKKQTANMQPKTITVSLLIFPSKILKRRFHIRKIAMHPRIYEIAKVIARSKPKEMTSFLGIWMNNAESGFSTKIKGIHTSANMQ